MDSNIKSENDPDNICFSADVQKAIEVLHETDSLDNNSFNCVDYINEIFPNEQSLSNIENIIYEMETNINSIGDYIRQTVFEQTYIGVDGPFALKKSETIIFEVFTAISQIKQKGEKTEEIVRQITKDIKQLDFAKKNLTSAITTLNHLHIVVGGIDSLTKLIEKRLYREILNPLQAIIEVNRHFKEYTDIPQVKVLFCNVEQIKQRLSTQITEDFHHWFSGSNVPKVQPSDISDACKLLSVLDVKARENLLKWFIDLQLEEYVQLFHENQDIAWLDKIDKRYAWFKSHLLRFEDKFDLVFPACWKVTERMAIKFCIITRNELIKIMKKRESELDVKLLLHAIAKTLHFEKLLLKRFGLLRENETKGPPDAPEKKPAGNELVTSENKDSVLHLNIIGICFEDHLKLYTESIDQSLNELIGRYLHLNEKPDNGIFPSSSELFLFYKKSISQCVQLNNVKPLLELALIFKKYLREYATKILERSLQKFTPTPSNISMKVSMLTSDLQQLSTTAGQVVHIFLKDDNTQSTYNKELAGLCCVLCTAEYCLETIYQLELKLNEKTSTFSTKKIDFADEIDIFHTLICNCVYVLVQYLENGCDPALNVMTKIQWHNIANVEDQSSYVSYIVENLNHTIPVIRDNLAFSKKYFVQLCHKFVAAFIPKYLNALYKCRLTNNYGDVNSIVGCEQLLLDACVLKTVLLNLPSLLSKVNKKAPASYTKVVVKGMTKAEMIIKLVMTPLLPFSDFHKQVLRLMPDVSISEYQKILDMKGVKKNDQTQLLDLYKDLNNLSKTPGSSLNEYSEQPLTVDVKNVVTLNSFDMNSLQGRIKKLETLIKNRLPK